MVQPLALDVAPAGQAPGWRKHEDIIDALPYVDTLNDTEKASVDALIREEVSRTHVTAHARFPVLRALCVLAWMKVVQRLLCSQLEMS